MFSNNIQFHFLKAVPSLQKRTALKRFLSSQAKSEGHKVNHINYIFCSDDYLLEVNKTHLKHDYYTDIITFQLNQTGDALLSDIYISVDRVRENAKDFKSTLAKELHRVIFHGMLHLLGYKDKTMKDSQLMRTKEDEWLKKYFVPRGTKKTKI